ncbi:MAG: glycosyl hydrolase [Roseibacillus sp.]
MLHRAAIIVLLFVSLQSGLAQNQPFFQPKHDPKPSQKTWVKVPELSDEFRGSSLDLKKWQSEPTGNGWTWIGRPPALFRSENVVVKGDMMNVTVSKLPKPYSTKKSHFTHQGAIVRSLHPGKLGWYFECRMKANATEMSSTFWLMTKGNHKKKLELDIQECVGKMSPHAESWVKNWDQIFHSNLIHRVNRHNPEKVQIQGQKYTSTKNHERFYVYGAWWKSPHEVQFFLDGEYVYSIKAPIEWDVPAFIQMAIETYDWNPLPADGGMVESGTWEQRTTKYDWVRTWRLE